LVAGRREIIQHLIVAASMSTTSVNWPAKELAAIAELGSFNI
jgi:hypothetical protein